MELSLKKGNHTELVSIKDENILKVLLPNTFSSLKTEEELLLDALKNPIGTERLRNIVKSGEKIAIITSDITRPMPSNRVLPLLLEELYAAGIKDEDIILYKYVPHDEISSGGKIVAQYSDILENLNNFQIEEVDNLQNVDANEEFEFKYLSNINIY